MAVFTGSRIRNNNVFGTLTDDPLSNVATTMNSAGLANLSAVSSNHAVLVIDPLRSAGAPEIVIVTAHTGSATSATVTRGAYGTSARQHALGVLWVHAATIDDMIRIVTSSTRPSDQYEGQLIYETDTDKFVAHTGSAWQEVVDLGDWDTYTPIDTNVTVGNGTRTARFTRIGRTIHFNWALTWGSTTSFGGTVNVGIPVAAASFSQQGNVSVFMLDSGTQSYTAGGVISASASVAQLFLGAGGVINGTSPFTWATGDLLVVGGTYQAAA